MLKEIPIFWAGGEEIHIQMSIEPIAVCPDDMDLNMLNRMVAGLRAVIEKAIIEEYGKEQFGTLS